MNNNNKLNPMVKIGVGVILVAAGVALQNQGLQQLGKKALVG